MVEETYVKILNNLNVLENLELYQNLHKEYQKNCLKHLSIVLGKQPMKVLENGEFVDKKYKRCLFCGKDISFSTNYSLEFDATNYKPEAESFEDLNNKYIELVNIFKNISKISSSEEELYSTFEFSLSQKRVLKK